MSEMHEVFHAVCCRWHLAKVTSSPDGFPVTRWIESCDDHSPKRTRAELVDAIARDAGRAFAILVAAGRHDEAEGVARAALEMNDAKGGA